MSSKDDPFGPNGRTVIKPARGPGQRKDIDQSRPSSPKRKADPTVIAPEPGRLRGKSETDPKNPRYIITVLGGGYRLLVSPPPPS